MSPFIYFSIHSIGDTPNFRGRALYSADGFDGVEVTADEREKIARLFEGPWGRPETASAIRALPADEAGDVQITDGWDVRLQPTPEPDTPILFDLPDDDTLWPAFVDAADDETKYVTPETYDRIVAYYDAHPDEEARLVADDLRGMREFQEFDGLIAIDYTNLSMEIAWTACATVNLWSRDTRLFLGAGIVWRDCWGAHRFEMIAGGLSHSECGEISSLYSVGTYQGSLGRATDWAAMPITRRNHGARFTFNGVDEIQWYGVNLDTTWEGFENVAVSEDDLLLMLDHYASAHRELSARLIALKPGADGWLRIGEGFSTDVVCWEPILLSVRQGETDGLAFVRLYEHGVVEIEAVSLTGNVLDTCAAVDPEELEPHEQTDNDNEFGVSDALLSALRESGLELVGTEWPPRR